MYGKTKAIICLLLGIFVSLSASAQDFSFGTRFSFKGMGITVEHSAKGNSFNSYSLSMDIYGLPTRRSIEPGAHFNFSHCIIFSDFENDGIRYSFYWGPGFSAGLVHDFEKGFFSQPGGTVLRKNMGLMAALSGSYGCRFIFRECINLDLRLTGEFGFHLRKDEILGNMDLSCYLNGLFRALYPQLQITYMF